MKHRYVTCSYKLSETDFWRSGYIDNSSNDVFSESGMNMGNVFKLHGYIEGIGILSK